MAIRLADHEPGVVSGQCCSCGAYDSAEWTMTIVRDRSSDMRAIVRLCEPCYRDALAPLLEPSQPVVALRGYQ